MTTENKNTLIIIPAYNEGDSIGVVVSEVRKYFTKAEIVVIDDGSSDNTAERALKEKVYVLKHIFNMGIGVSFQTGCQFALTRGYDYIVRIDADGQHNPTYITDILNPLIDDQADIVIGSRFLGTSKFKSSFYRIIGIKIIALFLAVITRKSVTDPTSGFYAMNKKAFKFFSKNCPDDYPEPEILIYHREFRIKEVPISISERKKGVSSITISNSIYYMLKVLLSLAIHVFRKET